MAGTRDTYRIARVGLTALAVALLVSIAITYLIGSSALSTAEAEASDGARVLTQENLATYVTGEDLSAPVGVGRAKEIDALVDGSILNGEIDAVTIWDPNGTIVYSSDPSLIGTRLPEERFALREVLKSGTSSTVQDGMFSTRVPLAPAGTDAEAIAQLDRVYAPLWAAAKPWRTASLSLSILLIAVLGAIYQVSRMASRRWKTYAGTTFQAMRGRRPAALGGGQGTDPAYVQADFRKAEEELARAAVRATTAEERAAALQEQYRKTLEELHAAQTKLEGAALETPSRPDPEIEERLLKAEGRVRLLEGQLQSVKGERDKLASDARELPDGTTPDPKLEKRTRAAEAEAAALRTELETAQHEVAGMVKELEATRKDRDRLTARTEDAGQQHAAATAEVEQTRSALATAQAELAIATSELQAARETVEQLQKAETRANEAEARVAQLDERSKSLEADLAQARQAAEGKIDEAQVAAEARTAAAETRANDAEARAIQAETRAAEEAARAAEEAARATETQAHLAEAEARMRDIEAAATGDVDAAVAQLRAANAAAEEAQAAVEAANARAAEAQDAVAAAQRDTAAARAEAESFRATAGTARAELEDAFRAELESREAELQLNAEAREAELRRSSEAREAELRAAVDAREEEIRTAVETRERALRDQAQAEIEALQEQTQTQIQELTDRLVETQAHAQAVISREQDLTGDLEAREHDLAAVRTREAELVAEMAALKEETRELLDAREQELRTSFAGEQTASFAKLQAATEADRARFETERAEMETREAELRAELDQLHIQLAGTSTDLGATGSELDTVRVELDRVRAEADASKTELQTVWSELESAQQELAAAIDQAHSRESELEAVRAEAQALRAGTEDADGALGHAQAELAKLHLELTDARDDLVRAQGDVQTELRRGVEMAERAEAAERELQEASMRAAAAEHELEQIRHEAEIAASEVATLREIADMQSTTAQEREALEEMLRVTQENLNGSNDRATEIQTRADAAEMALAAAREEVEELESRLRQIEMSQAVKQFVREDTEPAAALVAETPVEIGDAAALEDRRASTPFMQELSLDAKKSLTSILGLSLTLKHKSGPKEQAPLLRQLAAYARRLDHTVADLLDADKLARGEVELHMRRTDLEALVQRVVEESQVGNDHDVRLQTERIIASVDPVRTEQILMGLLRGSTDRTPLGSAITIRLTKGEGGALISVEDAEASSDASLSPVVARFADIQGGWAKVESRPNGGSAFRVFLPAEGIMPDSPTDDADPEIELSVSPRRTDLEIVVSDELDKERQLVAAADNDDPWAAGQLLVEELQKLSRDD